MSQDTFNKLVTSFLLVFCATLFTLAWWTGKAIDLRSFLVLIAPILAHTVHLVTDNMVNIKAIDKADHMTTLVPRGGALTPVVIPDGTHVPTSEEKNATP